MSNSSTSYEAVCDAYELEFKRNRELHGDRIQCRPGCSDCCHQLFQITEIEAAVISRGVAKLPEAQRDSLRERSARYLEQRRLLVSAKGEPEAWGSLPPPGTRLACPALVENVCSIYELRPVMCRKFGIPLWNPDRPGRVYACELNFKEGEEIVDPDLIQIQTEIHRNWKRLQADYNEQGGHRSLEPMTIAKAIVDSATHS